MPSVFLSPSVQEFNPYINNGNEEQYMNLIADAIEPYLDASGIIHGRNNPNETVRQAIDRSNAGNYELHVAIHSNASPPTMPGRFRGVDIYFSPNSFYGREFANILQNNFKNIYPDPSRVNIVPTTTLAEVRLTNAPAVLIEVAYHDNELDAEWIVTHINEIAEMIALSITEYFGVPFVAPIRNEDDFVVYNLII